MQDILKRLESGYSLPPLSVVAMKLVELASDDASSADDLASLIGRDPSLTVRLLKLANSAFYYTREPIKTVRQAVVMVGFNRLRIMALSLSIKDTFPMGRVGPMDFEKFWRSSLYVAQLAKSLAKRIGSVNPEEAFVAGLTLEIGLLILFDLYMKGRDEDIEIDLYPLGFLLAFEEDRWGINHREVGEAALKFWRFPENIVECQRYYGPRAWGEDTPDLPMILEVARESSKLICHKSATMDVSFSHMEDKFGLGPDIINDILVATFQEVQDIAHALKVELDSERDVIELMEKANSALSRLSEKMLTDRPDEPQKGLPSFQSLEGESGSRTVVTRTLEAVAHEIRNPLLAVGGFAKRLAETMEPSSAGGRYVQVILEEARRLEQALHDITLGGELK